jgi:flavin-dependent dehydrogenase
MTKPVAFSEDGARRVIAATKAHEAGNRDMPGIRFRDVGDDGDPVRLGKTTAAWTKGTTATINVWESGTPPSETQTSGVTLTGCVNKFANVATGKWVIVARGVNGSYYLIAAECS